MGLPIDNILLDGLTADPTVLTNGLVWYRSDLNEYRVYNNGIVEILAIKEWQPPQTPLGAIYTSGGTGAFINGGAGVYISLAGNADSFIYFNDVLDNGIAYDGSDLKIVIHARLDSNGGVGDNVKFNVNYAFIKDGDNSSTTVTSDTGQTFDVSAELQDIDFHIELNAMTGVLTAEELMITIERNSQGAGADTFAGALEVIGINLIKV